ncbi:MAG: hypothetical protein FWD77_07635 [Betaproteobacteria bacterium]|nr:hypothetical protein [Betaproteobacteria bacterium]
MFATKTRPDRLFGLTAHLFCGLCCALSCAMPAQAAVPAKPGVPEPAPAAAAPAAATSPAAAHPEQPDYNPIHEKNIFDPERKPWVEKPAEKTPAAPPISATEVQLYGVILVGNVKKALVKLDGRLKTAVPSTRPFVSLSEGQKVGEYTLAEIHPKELVFSAGDGRYRVAFNKKTDRPAPQAAPSVIQGPSAGTPDAPAAASAPSMPTPTPASARRSPASPQGAIPLPVPAPAPAPVADSGGGGGNTQSAASSSGSGASGSSPAPANTANAATPAAPGRGMSLIDAINQARSQGGAPSPNPFTANR